MTLEAGRLAKAARVSHGRPRRMEGRNGRCRPHERESGGWNREAQTHQSETMRLRGGSLA